MELERAQPTQVDPDAPLGPDDAQEDGAARRAPADRARIWQAFERGSRSKVEAVGGSGIGLTIVQQIAESHGGRAWVEDATTGGARFVVELPVAPASP